MRYLSERFNEQDFKNMEPGHNYAFWSEPDSGKSTMIGMHLIPLSERENKSILYLYPRSAIANQLKNKFTSHVIDYRTYQSLEEDLSKGIIINHYDYIVCDEPHYFVEDADFNDETERSFDFINNEKEAVKIFLTGTPEPLQYVEFNKPVIIMTNVDYSNNNVEVVFLTRSTKMIENQIRKELHDGQQTLVFSSSATAAYEMSRSFLEHNPFFISSKGNQTFKNKNDEDIREKIFKEEKTDRQIGFMTAAMDTGINFNEDVKNVVILGIPSSVSIRQSVARVRKGDNNRKVRLFIQVPYGQAIRTKIESMKRDLEFLDIGIHEWQKKYGSKKVADLKAYLKQNEIIEEEIDALNLKIEKKQQELFYAQSHLQNYRNSTITRDRNPILINKKKIHIEKINWRIKNTQKYLHIFQRLLEGGNESTSLNSLNNAIQDVYAYLVNNNENRICPVCSADRGDNLHSEIVNNIQNNLDKIAQKSNKINKINEKIKTVKQKIEKLEIDKLKIEKEIKNLDTEFLISEKNVLDIQNNILYNRAFFERELLEIEGLLKLSSEEITKINNYKVNFHTLRSLQRKLINLPQKELKGDQKIYDNLKSRSLTLSKRESVLKEFQELELQNIHNNEKEYETLNKNIFLLSKVLPSDQKHISIEFYINEILQEINSIKTQLEKLKKASNFFQMLKDNSKIEKNIQHYKDVISAKKKKIKIYDAEYQSINEHRDSIYNEIGSKASDLLNKPNSSIQKYFRYLNPVPSVNKVLFNSSSPEELEIVLSYKNEKDLSINQSNVQYSLSSGQLYVLAISIFLAINEVQSVSKLSFVGIDDPIQNMDDVNQFSICDVLSSINKQLIFSTHDFEFLKLYLKKNEYKKESIQVFMLEHNDYSVTNVKEINFNND
ncbi:hypothetical protein [Bacillus sp. SD075]|uniref:hypothetical protein n=1 Tax=Bacillus sp. SD075 TaxID=2781732 RepID=UPI0025711A6A|nr:hypothetical protein [Bacillus sp. SD075]